MSSSCEMGWWVSKYCTTLSQSWSVRCSRTVLGLQMAEVRGASLFFGAWGTRGAYGLCPPRGFCFFSWVAGMEKCWQVWKLCSRGLFVAHRHIRVDFGRAAHRPRHRWVDGRVWRAIARLRLGLQNTRFHPSHDGRKGRQTGHRHILLFTCN